MASNSNTQQQLVLATNFIHSDGNDATWVDAKKNPQPDDEHTKQLIATRLCQNLGTPGAFATVQSLGNSFHAFKGTRESDPKREDIRIYGTNKKRGFWDSRFGWKGIYPHWVWTQCGGTCFCFLCDGRKHGDYEAMPQAMLTRLPPTRLLTAATQAQVPQAQAVVVAPAAPVTAALQPKGKARMSGDRVDSAADIFDWSEHATEAPDAPLPQLVFTDPAADIAPNPFMQQPAAQERNRDNDIEEFNKCRLSRKLDRNDRVTHRRKYGTCK